MTKNGNVDENQGPDESERDSIKRKIEEIEIDYIKAQRDWIANQSDLINFEGSLAEIRGKINELQT